MKNFIKRILNKKNEYKEREQQELEEHISELLNAAIKYGYSEGANLDFSPESIRVADETLVQRRYEDIDISRPTENQIWSYCIVFGAYYGEVMLRNGLKDVGFKWSNYEEREPILYNETDNIGIRPIDKVYRRLTVGSFTHNLWNFYVDVINKYLQDKEMEDITKEMEIKSKDL